MNEEDTLQLLRECSAGVKMGITSLTDTLREAEDSQLRNLLAESRNEHARIGLTVDGLLGAYGVPGKSPPKMAVGMSRMKTALKLSVRPKDETVAALVTDGCNTGVKSLSRHLNRCEGASNPASQAAKDLIDSELHLADSLRRYL